MANRRVTIKDVAARAGVSVSLVSFVMSNQNGSSADRYRVNDETARRILRIAAEMNYQPNNAARSLRSGRSKVIGVILSDISNKFFADIARGIENRAFESGYSTFFGSTDESAERLSTLVEVFLNKGVDGLIVVPCEGSERTIRSIAERNVALVLLDRTIAGGDLDSVVLDNVRAGALATQALLRKGCRKIEMISYAMSLSNFREREAGFLQAMREADLERTASIRHLRHNEPGRMDDAIRETLARGAEGILFATNTLAMAGLKQIAHCGLRIPRDLRVATFDGLEAFDIGETGIIYVRQPIPEFSREAFGLLHRLIDCKETTPPRVHIVLSPELIDTEDACVRTVY